eukprot:XP_001704154.1 Hypothetical protein GL50803_118961 [Giardia lamblia ATCC 50803]
MKSLILQEMHASFAPTLTAEGATRQTSARTAPQESHRQTAPAPPPRRGATPAARSASAAPIRVKTISALAAAETTI